MLRPTIDVSVTLADLSIGTKALIDTGAPRTIFPRGIGDLIGIEFPAFGFDATKRMTVLGRDWPAITETVTLALEPFGKDFAWEADVDFVLEDGLPFALLGYQGFLNRWAVTFNGAYGYFVVAAADDQHAEQDDDLLAELRYRYPNL